jgi:hypothetical protein
MNIFPWVRLIAALKNDSTWRRFLSSGPLNTDAIMGVGAKARLNKKAASGMSPGFADSIIIRSVIVLH